MNKSVKTKARESMRSAIYWSIYYYKDSDTVKAKMEYEKASAIGYLLAPSEFIEEAFRQAGVQEIDASTWMNGIMAVELVAKEVTP